MPAADDTFEQAARRRLPRTALVGAAVIAVAVAGVLARPDVDPPGELAIDADEAPLSPEEPAEPGGPEEWGEPVDESEQAPVATAKPPESPGSWSTLSEAPLAPRSATPVWTGRELLVWGGQREGMVERPFFDDGAAYDPAAGDWRELPPAPLDPRAGHVAVWAGGELLVWGGQGRTRYHQDGAAYDPDADSWTTIPSGPLSPRRDAVAGWVGGELIVAGGYDGAGPLTDAAAYNPEDREWRTITGEVSPGFSPALTRATVLDDRLVVLSVGVGHPGESPAIGLYDPDTDRWDFLEVPAIFTDRVPDQWITATDDALVAISAQGTVGRPRMAVRDGDEWQEVDRPAGLRGWPQQPVSPRSEVVVADGDLVYVVDDAAEPLVYDLAEESWTALPSLDAASSGPAQTVPLTYGVVAVDDGLAVWLGGLAEPETSPSGEGVPAGVVVWRPED